MLAEMTALREGLVTDTACEPFPGHGHPSMLLRHVLTQLHL